MQKDVRGFANFITSPNFRGTYTLFSEFRLHENLGFWIDEKRRSKM